jgi:hypothetical protein
MADLAVGFGALFARSFVREKDTGTRTSYNFAGFLYTEEAYYECVRSFQYYFYTLWLTHALSVVLAFCLSLLLFLCLVDFQHKVCK